MDDQQQTPLAPDDNSVPQLTGQDVVDTAKEVLDANPAVNPEAAAPVGEATAEGPAEVTPAPSEEPAQEEQPSEMPAPEAPTGPTELADPTDTSQAL